MATRENPSPQSENERWAQKRLGLLRDHLVPSSTFYAQTKASLFQKIAADKELRRQGIFSGAVRRWIGVVTSAAVLAGVFFSTSFISPQVTMAYVGEFGDIQGDVFIHRAAGTVRAQSKDKIFEGDTIEVASASNAKITLTGDTRAELSENTKIKVNNVLTMRVDNTVVSSQVRLELEKGTYSQTRTEPQETTTLITLATPSGTIKASSTADYTVNADNHDMVALSVHSSGVTVVREGEDVQIASGQVVSEGQSVVLNEGDTGVMVVTTTDPLTATGSLIATASEKDPVKQPVRTPAKDPMKQPIAETDPLEVPKTASIEVPVGPSLEGVLSRLDIAEVKMEQVIGYHTAGQTDQARMSMSSYVSTAKDVYKNLTNSNSNASSVVSSLDQMVAQSPLAQAYGDLTAMSNVDKTSEAFKKTLQSLETLSKAEAALRMDIASRDALASNQTAARTESMSMMAAPAPVVPAPEVDLTARTYAKQVQTGIIGEAQAIVADTDLKRRSTSFVQLLARIPNESRNIPLLERLQSMAPENLRGFVEVKIHQIKYPEAK